MRTIVIAAMALLLVPFGSKGQMIELPLADRIQDCSVIFEGKVIDQHSYWKQDKTIILTNNVIEVYKVFKGTLNQKTVHLVTEGGQVEDYMVKVEPNLILRKGEVGIFMADLTAFENRPPTVPPRKPSGSSGSAPSGSTKTVAKKGSVSTATSSSLSMTSVVALQPHAVAQGFIKYDQVGTHAADPFYKYADIKRDVHKTISGMIGKAPTEVQKYDHYKAVARRSSARSTPSISSFSPDTITAGSRSVLTINGSNFGSSYSGSADVQFRNANDGGSTLIGLNSGFHIVSWSSTQIKLNVPTQAGTGTFRVLNDLGNASAVTSSDLTVLYNNTNLSNDSLPDFADDNDVNGYTYSLNYEFASNEGAEEAFRRSLNTWRCATKMNITIADTLISDSCQSTSDGKNIVTFDNHCGLGGGTLGTAYSGYSGSGCGSPLTWYWNVVDIDIKFDESPTGGWYYGVDEDSIGGSQYDFESVSVHEFGHNHQLGHVINTNWVMHYNISNGEVNRALVDISDVAGGQKVMDRSLNDNPCGPDGMDSLTNDTITWTGGNNTYWWDGDNWDPKFVPVDCNIIYVPGTSTATNQPTIARDFAKCREIEIESSDSGEVTITSDGALEVKSDAPEPSP